MLFVLGGLAARHPRALTFGALVFAAAGFVLGGPVAGKLSGTGIGDRASESRRADAALVLASGRDPDADLLAVVRLGAPPGSPAARAKVAAIVRTLRRDFGLVGVAGPYSSNRPELVSRDGRYALVIAPGVGEGKARRIEAAFASDGDVRFGGGPVISHEVSDTVTADVRRAELIALPLLFLLSFWAFRGVVAALLPPLVGLITIAGALLTLRVAGEVTELSVYALNLVTGLGLGLAIDWSLFMVSRYREELARAGPGVEAIRETMATAGRTVAFSALTVAAALASLLVFPQSFLRSMGIGGIAVSLVGAMVALVFLPAVLVLLGRRVNSLAPRRLRRASEEAARPASSGFWYRLSRFVTARPLPVAAAAATALLVLGLPFLGIKFIGFDPSALPKSASGRQVDETLRARFAPNLDPAITAVVRAHASEQQAVSTYADRLRALPGRPAVGAPTFVGRDTWRIDVGTRANENSQRDQQLVREIRALAAPLPVLVGGPSAFLVDQKDSLADHVPLALAIIVATTFLVLFLMTGSAVLPLKAILLNLLTISAVFGALVWIFQEGRLEGLLGYTSQGGIDATQPVLIAALAFALSTDYGVFLLTRIKEERDKGADDATAVAVGLERTGRMVTAAALLFLVAMGAFGSSRIVTIKEVGLGTGLAVLIDATIVRALLVPSLMCLLGRWNWVPRLRLVPERPARLAPVRERSAGPPGRPGSPPE